MFSTDGTSESEDGEANGGGLPSYAGYEYQMLATVWIALELMVRGTAGSVVVEPASKEDVLAHIDHPTEEQRELAGSLVAGGDLQIQIKLRNNSILTSPRFRDLLETKESTSKGQKPRERAVQYLAKKNNLKYLLLTSAAVAPELRCFVVKKMGNVSTAARLPAGIKAPDHSLAPRIGILPEMTEGHLNLLIKDILLEHCHVPADDWEACRDALKDEVRLRFLDRLPSTFNAEGIKNVVLSCGGSFNNRPEPVEPMNFAAIKQKLAERHALVLVGPPGTGKTTIALHLLEQLEKGMPPAKRISVKDAQGLALIGTLLSQERDHVFYLEDPWGQDEPGAQAAAITKDLPILLAMARKGKSFIVTSRQQVFTQATHLRCNSFKSYLIHLTPDDYKEEAKRAIYDGEIRAWPREFREVAIDCAEDALKKLLTPYSIFTFCRFLHDELRSGNRYLTKVAELAERSNVETFGSVLIEWIDRAGDDLVGAAVAIWAQLVSTPFWITRENADELVELMELGNHTDTPDVVQLFDQLVGSDWIQRRESGYASTPSVREGLSSFERSQPKIFRKAIQALTGGWIIRGKFEAVLSCVRAATLREKIVANTGIPLFDAFLIGRLQSRDSREFRYNFGDLGRYSQGGDPVAILARALSRRAEGERKWFNPQSSWVPPEFDDADLHAIRSSKDCEILTARFVKDYLPEEVSFHPSHEVFDVTKLTAFFQSFGWSVSPWFHAAFIQALNYPEPSLEYLVRCLVHVDSRSPDLTFEPCLACFRSNNQYEEGSDPNLILSMQGEIDEGYEREPDFEREYYAFKALSRSFNAKRIRDGYGWIVSHPAEADILAAWGEFLLKQEDHVEWQHFLERCDFHGKPTLGYSLANKWKAPFFDHWTVAKLREQQERIPDLLASLVVALVDRGIFHGIVESQGGPNVPEIQGLGEYLSVAASGGGYSSWDEPPIRPQNLISGLPETLKTLFESFSKKDQSSVAAVLKVVASEKNGAFYEDPLQLARAAEFVTHWPTDPAIHALQAYMMLGGADVPLSTGYLASEIPSIRAKAIALSQNEEWLSSVGLSDPDCWCRVSALGALSRLDAALDMDAIAGDRSAFVRRAFAEEAGRRSWVGTTDLLLNLLADNRDFGTHSHEDDQNRYDVAVEAATSLRTMAPLSDNDLERIRQFLKGGHHSSMDTRVHSEAFRIIGLHATKDSMDFCINYLTEVWPQSEWRIYDGYHLLDRCREAMTAMISESPDLSSYIGSYSHCPLGSELS